MKFEEILPHLRAGKVAKRNKQNSELFILFKSNRILCKNVSENKTTNYGFYSLRLDDIEAEDWEQTNEI
jgi:hypothetical protein